ncbi:F-box protein At5g49610-like [Lolium perenne]|uniref:F-box protein At5g49610-like n=1 Tax=Lolium perenne TaxID=4522 RepID=UPI0021F5DE7B|nr:F-box protein At5g49610-like [Lolium perenne]
MAEATRTPSKILHRGLPDEIVIWEILLRLPPESVLRCRAVCRAWHLATSTRDFLLAHHRRQPSLPIICGYGDDVAYRENILVLDHRATDGQLQCVARLDDTFSPRASCDGLLILSKYDISAALVFSICNPVTRQHAPLRQLSGFSILGMYLHQPTCEYRLLLRGESTVGHLPNNAGSGCYVFALGSDQPPRYIGTHETPSSLSGRSTALVRDSLHWYLVVQRQLVLVFDTTSESFRHMRAPVVSGNSDIFEMDGTLGIYSRDYDTGNVDIWVLQNYECEVWDCKYRVKLPVVEISGQLESWHYYWDVRVVLADSDVHLMVTYGKCLCYVDTDGKLVASFHRGRQILDSCQGQLKQTLVQHNFFTALQGYSVNPCPFV